MSSYNAAVANDENHGWVFVGVGRAENCWVRRVVSQYFGYACVSITSGGRQICADCKSLIPYRTPQADGGAFIIDSATQCFVWNCQRTRPPPIRHRLRHAGPHAFVSSSATARR